MEVNQVDQALRYLAEHDAVVAVTFEDCGHGLVMRMEVSATICELRHNVATRRSVFALMRGASAVHRQQTGQPLCWQ